MARHVGRAIRMKQKIRMKKQEVPRVLCSGAWLKERIFQRQAMPLLRVNNTRRGDSPRW